MAAAAAHGNVVVVTSFDHFKQHLNEAKASNKGVVIDFTATWCGPCRFIGPIFDQLSEKFTNVVFLKVDVDDRADVAKEYTVEAMPSFVFLKDGAEVDRLVGADKTGLETKITSLAAGGAACA
ncbi:hypothetical protein LUZ60_005299 [Juncus effusus]|nr:hypothetical protein LUZ60_005299 [Juncus effusus]